MSTHKNDGGEDRRLLPERTVSIEEAAKLYGVTRQSLRKWIASGRLRGYRFGPRLIRIEIDDLEALYTPMGPGESA